MSKVKTLVVPANPYRRMFTTHIEGTLEGIRAAINVRWIEVIDGEVDGAPWHAYLDEEGKLNGSPVNARATQLVRQLGWANRSDILMGDVLFLAMDEAGEETDVPDFVIAEAVAQDHHVKEN